MILLATRAEVQPFPYNTGLILLTYPSESSCRSLVCVFSTVWILSVVVVIMERTARPKKVSKAAAALESLRAVKAGEKKVLDVVGLEDEMDDLPDESDVDHDDAYEMEDSPEDKASGTGKSKSGADGALTALSTILQIIL